MDDTHSLWSRIVTRFQVGPWELEATGDREWLEMIEASKNTINSIREHIICAPGYGPILLKGQRGCWS